MSATTVGHLYVLSVQRQRLIIDHYYPTCRSSSISETRRPRSIYRCLPLSSGQNGDQVFFDTKQPIVFLPQDYPFSYIARSPQLLSPSPNTHLVHFHSPLNACRLGSNTFSPGLNFNLSRFVLPTVTNKLAGERSIAMLAFVIGMIFAMVVSRAVPSSARCNFSHVCIKTLIE